MGKSRRIKGVYVLLMKSLIEFDLNIGMLGRHRIPRGYLIYVGSGLNGLLNRIDRHFRREKKIKWHIDYLTVNPNIVIFNAIYAETREKMECIVSEEIFKSGFTPIIKKFGSTDCKKCFSHLYYSRKNPTQNILKVFRKIGLKPILWKKINN